ncbi:MULTISPECIES: toll/interleukin-1 receptor domain-containing protein [Blautia]|uniref:TIR domain-containing protein n=4 Tax=Blautia TaxID=572511 RepID=A0A6L8T062_9FIRM|nr:toll/interleukin-1 receptor domain-containing protein [Blautia wexlerae]MZL32058.1 TIR domain-containing protein [Blautia wexlerae]MZT14026.1 TIR domain-containing protein [Blautia wexlerae]MZT31990.1 TIR domain-containing protein [Blautia wexlerae]MZT40041.1 TIR domain-containing protein [Blautia wexlerae]MZT44391.1 TIR domain-containing protein [Blautia wexlerae]
MIINKKYTELKILNKGDDTINNCSYSLFICFAAEDRYSIVEPLVYHLKNYGIKTWYDRDKLLMGDNREEINLEKGVWKCNYALVVISKFTVDSVCAMEELSIIESKYRQGKIIVFPVVYELSPNDIPDRLCWIKELIFKEVDRHSGTREVCSHIVCKITGNILNNCIHQKVRDIISTSQEILPSGVYDIIRSYLQIDHANLNSRISLLYAAYLVITDTKRINANSITNMVSCVFDRLFSETRLNLPVDYRELWLLENSLCILIDFYIDSCTESRI